MLSFFIWFCTYYVYCCKSELNGLETDKFHFIFEYLALYQTNLGFNQNDAAPCSFGLRDPQHSAQSVPP
jgi:hypothetical protein